MPIITLITDLGETGHYVAMVKAKILSQQTDAQIIDITHSINQFDIAEAAYVLKTMLREFPKGTIHIIGVGTQSVDDVPHIGILYKDQYILTADNGLFNLIAEQQPELIVELNMTLDTDMMLFPIRDIYAPAAVFLAKGGTLEVIGRRTEQLVQRLLVKPMVGPDYIQGKIINVDSFGNAISNIDQKLIKDVGKGRGFAIGFVQKGYEITDIKKRYYDVPAGERLALINTAGHLEIAINQGYASELLGLQIGEKIIMTFG